ncbi:MAG: hypothetical protein PHF89_06575 [Eubacteriales bacterium]|nr:hypothetical protein [Eubacteriales bacterium]
MAVPALTIIVIITEDLNLQKKPHTAEEWVATVHFATLIFKNIEFHRKINEVSKNHIFDTSFVYSLTTVYAGGFGLK